MSRSSGRTKTSLFCKVEIIILCLSLEIVFVVYVYVLVLHYIESL